MTPVTDLVFVIDNVFTENLNICGGGGKRSACITQLKASKCLSGVVTVHHPYEPERAAETKIKLFDLREDPVNKTPLFTLFA